MPPAGGSRIGPSVAGQGGPGFGQPEFSPPGNGQQGFGQAGFGPEQPGTRQPHAGQPAAGQPTVGFEQPGFAPYEAADIGQRSRLSVNPFIVALWVLEAILLVSPFGVFTLAQESLNSGTEPQVMPVSYMWITFAPQMLFAGLVGALGLLFWHAAQWQRNRAKQPPPS
ncbi:hypothetical protein ACFRAU_00760 [Arthrobacter sp. NPDC056691]|uniref:hypothetical protein n=1 Tax=Arthrobacter sp. NPDC056691 TaxID=3345913 RepID=UPI00366F4061